MTGSILPRRARSMRSRVYRFNAWYSSSGLGSVIREEPRTSFSDLSSASFVAPRAERRFAVAPAAGSVRASRKCSVETYSSPNSRATSNARSKTRFSSGDTVASAEAPVTLGRLSRSASTSRVRDAGSTPSFWRIGTTTPSSCERRASRRWSGESSALPRARASRCASWTAS